MRHTAGETLGSSRTRTGVYLAVLVVLSIACATVMPPPGGPKDETPPALVASTPRPDSAGVSPEGPIELLFSEPLKPQDLTSKIRFYPPVEIREAKARGRRVEVVLEEPLHPDTTYLFVIRAGVLDQHNVATKSPVEVAFATAATLQQGEITGEVWFKKKPSRDAELWLYAAAGDSGFDPAAGRPAREAGVDPAGKYTFSHLPTDGSRFLLFAFQDAGRDGKYNPEADFSALYPDTLELTTANPVRAARRIVLIDPNEPGALSGRIVDPPRADRFVTLRLLPDRKRPLLAFADTTGDFSFSQVPPGSYALWAFLDFEPDSVCGEYVDPGDSTVILEEPCQTFPDSITISPGETLELPEIPWTGIRDPDRPFLPPGTRVDSLETETPAGPDSL